MGSQSDVPSERKELARELHQLASLGVRLMDSGSTGVSVLNLATSSLDIEVKRCQYKDPKLRYYRDACYLKEKSPFEISADGILRYRNRLCVPDIAGLRRMKKDIAEFVTQCSICQLVKIEHQKPAGLLQEMGIPIWKWEAINMDFFTGLPRSQHKFNSIWVIVDRLMKSAHFLPLNSGNPFKKDWALK
ncbi:uncharacterized protein LOC132644425 [Lycium barbarum]|uniref:uncharacterized protein LOC132644425 n=1 Tax=Lycium barbarum TaxID=112863 RepID=UPI00293E1D23|nr:uncharacterized protein LOC132644425 [Lycium barbarum]